MHAKQLLPTLVFIGLIQGASAQSVEEVLASHVEALGGESAMKGIQTALVQGVRYQEDRVENFTLYQKGEKYRYELKVDGETRVSGFDGKTAWREGELQQMRPDGGPMGGRGGGPPGGGRGGFPGGRGGNPPRRPGGEGSQQQPADRGPGMGAQQMIRLESPLYLAMSQEDGFKLKGKAFIDGVETLEIQGTSQDKNKAVTSYFLDTSTWLLLKTSRQMEMRGNKMRMESLFSDYQETHGLMVARAINRRVESPRGERVTDTVIVSLEINVDLDDRLFEKPKN